MLFVVLTRPGVLTHCNPIPQMLNDHDAGRGATRRMAEGLEAGNVEQFCESAREFIQVLRDHIYKEDNILFPMAEQSLSEEDREKLDSEAQLLQATGIGSYWCCQDSAGGAVTGRMSNVMAGLHRFGNALGRAMFFEVRGYVCNHVCLSCI